MLRKSRAFISSSIEITFVPSELFPANNYYSFPFLPLLISRFTTTTTAFFSFHLDEHFLIILFCSSVPFTENQIVFWSTECCKSTVTHTHTHTYIYTFTQTCTHTNTLSHTHTHIHFHTHTHSLIYECIFIFSTNAEISEGRNEHWFIYENLKVVFT